MSEPISLSGISGPSRFHCTEKKRKLQWKIPLHVKNFDRDLEEEINSNVLEKSAFENLDKFIIKTFLALPDFQKSFSGLGLIACEHNFSQKLQNSRLRPWWKNSRVNLWWNDSLNLRNYQFFSFLAFSDCWVLDAMNKSTRNKWNSRTKTESFAWRRWSKKSKQLLSRTVIRWTIEKNVKIN